MIEVRRSTIVDAPIDDVWRILRDFNGHERWHPAIASSRMEGGEPTDKIGGVRDFRLKAGGRLREQLLSLSNRDHTLSYCLLESPLPLMGYVAQIRLKPVTDGDRTFWEWRSSFDPPVGQRESLARLVAEEIYEAGFRTLKRIVSQPVRAPAPEPQRLRPAVSSGASASAQAIIVSQYGGPEVLELRTVAPPPPGQGQLRIRQSAVGVNYIDVYCRTGYFDLLQLPGIPGLEGAGVVDAVPPGETQWRIGARIAYAGPPIGAYAALRTMDANLIVALPPEVDEITAAASLLKGMTASFLLHEVYRLKQGDVIAVHAAAGGVGLLLVQWARALGARVIGIVSSQEKAARAQAAGCEQVIVTTEQGFAAEMMRLTGGRGVDAIYDAVGRDSFAGSVECLAERGHLISFGQASGPIGSYDISRLTSRSITLSRPNYGHYAGTPEQVRLHSGRFFAALRAGLVRVEPPTRYRLADAAQAHRDLEARRTIGSLVLIP